MIYGGKGLGGGYVPMGMVATTGRVAEPLAELGGFMFFTFTGGDAMCAGADKVLEILEREDLVARCRGDRRGAGARCRRRSVTIRTLPRSAARDCSGESSWSPTGPPGHRSPPRRSSPSGSSTNA